MNRLLSLAPLLLFLGSNPSHAELVSGAIVNPANGHDYFLAAATNWTAMEAEAVALGGHLATIRNSSENAWVWSTFTALDGDGDFFIGLNDHAQEGTFVWASGEAGTYTNWRPGEPNNANGNEDFALVRATDGLWNDVQGLSQFGVIEIVPEPSTLALLAAGGGVLAFTGGRRMKTRFVPCTFRAKK